MFAFKSYIFRVQLLIHTIERKVTKKKAYAQKKASNICKNLAFLNNTRKFVYVKKKLYLCTQIENQKQMKRITTMVLCLLCTLTMMGEKHMMFRTLPIDGDLKAAVKEVKKWGFMGMKIKNVAALMGTLDGEDVMLTLMATPKTNTLFSVTVIYEGAEQWNEQMVQYQAINATIAAQYGEPTDIISQWEEPYSIDNNPTQAFKENKATYGNVYTTPEGKVAVNIIYSDGKMCTIVAYIDDQNAALFKTEGGKETIIDEDADME